MPDASATKPAFGLTAKIFLASALLVVAVLGITFGVTSIQANRTADESIHRALIATRRAVDDYLAARTRTLGRASTVATDVPQYRQRLLNQRNRAEALDQADDVRDLIGASWVLVTNNDGILIARTDYREQDSVDLSIAPLVANALSGDQTSGAWLDDLRGTMFIAVGTPLRDRPDAAPLGALIATYQIDDSLAGAIKQNTNSDVVFFALDTLEQPVVVGSTLPAQAVSSVLRDGVRTDTLAADSAGTGIALAATLGGEHLIGLAGPIRSSSGELRGGFVALRSRDAELAAFSALRRTMLFAVALGVVLALIVAFLQARQIARPVRRLALATRRVQAGDYGVDIEVNSRDEIGVLSRAFKSLVEDLKEKAALVDYMAASGGVGRAAVTQPIASTGVRETASDQLRPGAIFAGRYEVQEMLGAGGMGVVYRAFDRELEEPVAIKTLRPEAMAGGNVALERFKQEIRLARRIAHRNVVRTYDLGEVNGMYYLTMEYVDGTSLRQLIEASGKLPVAVALTIGKQLCRALEVAHAEGIIHRDIKPSNVVVDPSGFLKVMDFGIARLANPPQGKGLTEAGVSIGTPDYMSPEQLAGVELDARTDLYAVGIVLFECLTGRVPYLADTPWALVAQHMEEDPPSPRALNAAVPEALAAVILKALAKDPAQRFPSASEMHDALAEVRLPQTTDSPVPPNTQGGARP
ncbi:MAG TPA: protein kinase [Gemmatimonadales bacterium]|nr:protein kinase [Gemmatimonadales bacterium]